jgi:hypothetical protein
MSDARSGCQQAELAVSFAETYPPQERLLPLPEPNNLSGTTRLCYLSAIFLSPAPAAHRAQDARSCQPLEAPKEIPSLASLLDSVALMGRIAESRVSDPSELRIAVAFPQSGPPRTWLIEAGPASVSAGLSGLVHGMLRAGGAPPGTNVRLHLRIAAPIAVRVERSVLCAPVPLGEDPKLPDFQLKEGNGSAPPRTWKGVIRQRIGTEGEVLEAKLVPGSGRAEIDRVALEPVYGRRWKPATLDGRPVAVWFTGGRVELVR